MKKGLDTHLQVQFPGINLASVARIDIVFKARCSREAPVLKSSVYISDGTGDAQKRTGTSDTIDIPWSASDSDLFDSYSPVYMDTRIYYSNTTDSPETEIVTFSINDTLFGGGEE